MSRVRELVARLIAFARAGHVQRDLDRQLESHLAEAVDDYVREGMPLDDARRAAVRRLGDSRRIREACRETHRFLTIDHAARDLHQALRSLGRSRGFLVATVGTLSIGIAGVVLVFALLHGVVLRPLPLGEPDRLVAISHTSKGLTLDLTSGLSAYYAERATSLDGLAVYRAPVLLNLRLPEGGTERVQVASASAGLFAVLRVVPIQGRLFTADDGKPGFMNLKWRIPILLAHDFWQARFGGDPSVVGRVLTINDNPRVVVGVLPAGFSLPQRATQIWMLSEPPRQTLNFARVFGWKAVGRMRSGATAASVRGDLARILPGVEGVYPDATRARIEELALQPVVTPLKTAVVGDVARVLWLVFGSMAVLLLVAVASAAGLFSLRAEHRRREVLVRRALGAVGPHLVRLFLIEALLVTLVAAAIGVGLARLALPLVLASMPYELPRAVDVGIDRSGWILATAVAVLIGTGYAVLGTRRQQGPLASMANNSEGWATTGRRVQRTELLLVAQVALALVLMAGAALMLSTYRNLSRRPLGFAADGVLTMEIGLPSRKAAQHARIYRDVVAQIRALHGVDDASAASFAPLTVASESFPLEAGADPVLFKFFVPGYFRTMRTETRDGDALDAGNASALPHPVVISASLARRLHPGVTPVGRTVRRLNEDGTVVDVGGTPIPPFTIVGVVADVPEVDLRESRSEVVYVPLVDPPSELSIVPTSMTLVVRSPMPNVDLVESVTRTIRAVEPDLSIGRVRSMESIVFAARAREAFIGVLLLGAAVVALVLGVVGVYSSVGHIVRRRTREIGVRVALGATPLDVMRLVTAGAARTLAAGGLAGLFAALSASQVLSSMLFGVDANDPALLLLVTGCLVAAGAAAAVLAARGALRASPIDILRRD